MAAHGADRIEDVVDRFADGDGSAEITTGFEVPSTGVEDVFRVALRVRALRPN